MTKNSFSLSCDHRCHSSKSAVVRCCFALSLYSMLQGLSRFPDSDWHAFCFSDIAGQRSQFSQSGCWNSACVAQETVQPTGMSRGPLHWLRFARSECFNNSILCFCAQFLLAPRFWSLGVWRLCKPLSTKSSAIVALFSLWEHMHNKTKISCVLTAFAMVHVHQHQKLPKQVNKALSAGQLQWWSCHACAHRNQWRHWEMETLESHASVWPPRPISSPI